MAKTVVVSWEDDRSRRMTGLEALFVPYWYCSYDTTYAASEVNMPCCGR